MSKNLIIKKVQNHTLSKLNRTFDKLKISKIKNAFSLWRENSSKIKICKKIGPTGSYQVRSTVANNLWSSHLIKSKKIAIGILFQLLSQYYENAIKKKFQFWKFYARKSKNMLIRFYDKWNVKTSRIKLNKMNIRRFFNILSSQYKNIIKQKTKKYWIIYLNRIKFLRFMEKVKLIFVAWKKYCNASKLGKVSIKRHFLNNWKFFYIEESDENEVCSFCTKIMIFA